MKRVRVVTVLSLSGVPAAGAVATVVNTSILGAVTAGSESSSESLRAAEEVVDPASVTPEQAAAAPVQHSSRIEQSLCLWLVLVQRLAQLATGRPPERWQLPGNGNVTTWACPNRRWCGNRVGFCCQQAQ